MQICLSPGRETENLFGVALEYLDLVCNFLEGHLPQMPHPGSAIDTLEEKATNTGKIDILPHLIVGIPVSEIFLIKKFSVYSQ